MSKPADIGILAAKICERFEEPKYIAVFRAISEERERCAKIAERACDQHGFWDDGVEIASAIRNEGEQKT